MGATVSQCGDACVPTGAGAIVKCDETACDLEYGNRANLIFEELNDDACDCGNTESCDVGCKTFARVQNFGFRGARILRAASIASTEACARRCFNVDECVAATFESSSGDCNLHSGVQGTRHIPNVDTVFRTGSLGVNVSH
jgi:hypothetical protein